MSEKPAGRRGDAGIARPRPGPDWTLVALRRRSSWTDDREACAACDADVRLDDDHQQMELARDVALAGRKLRFERERYVFCDRSCAERWLDAQELEFP